MESLLKKKKVCKSKLTKKINDVEKATLTDITANAYLDDITAIYAKLSDIHDDIVEAAEEADIQPFIDEFNESTDQFDTTKFKLLKFIKESSPTAQKPGPTNNGSSSSMAQIKLPKLNLPTFNGDQKEWTNFHDLFKFAVHDNQTLSGAQRLQYLKSSLHGEPHTTHCPHRQQL